MCDRSEYVPNTYARWEGRRRRRSPEELAAKYAPAPDREHHDRTTAEFHAATDRTGLPQPPRHRGITLPDGAPDRWEE